MIHFLGAWPCWFVVTGANAVTNPKREENDGDMRERKDKGNST